MVDGLQNIYKIYISRSSGVTNGLCNTNKMESHLCHSHLQSSQILCRSIALHSMNLTFHNHGCRFSSLPRAESIQVILASSHCSISATCPRHKAIPSSDVELHEVPRAELRAPPHVVAPCCSGYPVGLARPGAWQGRSPVSETPMTQLPPPQGRSLPELTSLPCRLVPGGYTTCASYE